MKNLLFFKLYFIVIAIEMFGHQSVFSQGSNIFLMGDSTMANYEDNYDVGVDYYETRFPVTGWGQAFKMWMNVDSLKQIKHFVKPSKTKLINLARGGRSTRTFFQEGRWRQIDQQLKPKDLVIIQFGHNDAAKNKPERYVDVEGFKTFLRFYVETVRSKKAIPVLLTPVARNYPWENGVLQNVHGEYDEAVKEIARETECFFIDLNELSRSYFTAVGQEMTTQKYFMNLEAGKYKAYPEGQKDNTHFQPEGARAVAQLVFNELVAFKNRK